MESSNIINLLDLGVKMRSKSELYRFLTHEANLYLPPYKECSIEFITDYLEGKKIVLKTSQVTVKSIPQLKGLRSEDLYTFLIEDCNAQDYLPEVKHHRFPNRQWLSNIANSLNSDRLHRFVQNVMENRQFKILSKRGLTIKVSEDLENAISQSKSISTVNGRSPLMLNTQKRNDWRAKKKVIEQWPEQQKLTDSMKDEIMHLHREVQDQMESIHKNKKNENILANLFDNGIIDEDGNIL